MSRQLIGVGGLAHHAEELFAAIPALQIMMVRDSPIDRAYSKFGFEEPWHNSTGAGRLLTGKLLIRKVATIHYALNRLRGLCDYVVWGDSDVEWVRPFDEPFAAYMSKYDVVYTPFAAIKSKVRWTDQAWSNTAWCVESGVSG